MRVSTIYKDGDLEVLSHGNGWAYILRNGSADAWLQGDDAQAFRESFDAADSLPPNRARAARANVIRQFVERPFKHWCGA